MGAESELHKLEAAIEKIMVTRKVSDWIVTICFLKYAPLKSYTLLALTACRPGSLIGRSGKNYHKMKTHYD
jgi:hypothetical protein